MRQVSKAALNYMKENGLTTLIDLGAGEGHPIELLNDLGFDAKGYEIEDELIDVNQERKLKEEILKQKYSYEESECKDIEPQEKEAEKPKEKKKIKDFSTHMETCK